MKYSLCSKDCRLRIELQGGFVASTEERSEFPSDDEISKRHPVGAGAGGEQSTGSSSVASKIAVDALRLRTFE